MPKEWPYWLHSISVVVTAEYHNPSILNKDFLVSKGILPHDWETTLAITTPQVSVLQFQNGIQWTVDQMRLVVAERCECPLQAQSDYVVHGLLDAYLERLPHVPYRSLGLNWTLSHGLRRP